MIFEIRSDDLLHEDYNEAGKKGQKYCSGITNIITSTNWLKEQKINHVTSRISYGFGEFAALNPQAPSTCVRDAEARILPRVNSADPFLVHQHGHPPSMVQNGEPRAAGEGRCPAHPQSQGPA